jgi:UDP-glucose 4-epimerase
VAGLGPIRQFWLPVVLATSARPFSGHSGIADAISAHLLAMARAPETGFGRYIASATTQFVPQHLAGCRVMRRVWCGRSIPIASNSMARGWRLFSGIDRVYVNDHARRELGWHP